MFYVSFPDGLNWQETLADGHAGTLRTLETMKFLVRKDYNREDTRKTVNAITQAAPLQRPVESLFLFARDQIRYVPDPPNLEKISQFNVTTQTKEGDCDDKVIWLATGLLSLNVPVRFVVQSYGGGTWDHVYLEFWDWPAWEWVSADPTADGHTGLIAPLGWRQPLPTEGREMIYEV